MRAAAPPGRLPWGAEHADQALPAPAAAVPLGLPPLGPGLLSLFHHELLETDAAPRVARGDPLVQAGLQLPRTLADGQEPRGAHLTVRVRAFESGLGLGMGFGLMGLGSGFGFGLAAAG